MAELYQGMPGSPVTFLINDITSSQTTIEVANGDLLPDGPNICTIGYGENIETIKFESKSGGTLFDVTRGIEGNPLNWKAGTEVARFFTAYDHQAILENCIWFSESEEIPD